MQTKRISLGKEPFNLLLSAKSKQDLPADETESPSKEVPKKEEVYIKVTARLRPMLAQELNSKEVVSALKDDANSLKIYTNNYFNNGERIYKFERVFKREESQESIFEHCGKPLCDSFVKGQNCNIIVYGPTSTGKTYTM